MAENKKSIVMYSDWENIFIQLDDNEAGALIKHFFAYVNDRDPVLEDRLLKMAFEPIKMQLKRDLAKWEETKIKRSEAGKAGGLRSGESRSNNKQNEANASNPKQNEANEAVNVLVNVPVTVNDIFSLKDNYDEKKENGITVHEIIKPTPIEILSSSKLKFESVLMATRTAIDSPRIKAWSDYYMNKHNDYYNKIPDQLAVALKGWLERPDFGNSQQSNQTEPKTYRRARKEYKAE